jgi:hypothetical protein
MPDSKQHPTAIALPETSDDLSSEILIVGKARSLLKLTIATL